MISDQWQTSNPEPWSSVSSASANTGDFSFIIACAVVFGIPALVLGGWFIDISSVAAAAQGFAGLVFVLVLLGMLVAPGVNGEPSGGMRVGCRVMRGGNHALRACRSGWHRIVARR